jgi:hypothetical protein
MPRNWNLAECYDAGRMEFKRPGDTITNEQLLAEIEDILRSMPPRPSFPAQTAESVEWTGRAAAAINRWDLARGPSVNLAVDGIGATNDIVTNARSLNKLIVLLNEARADLRMSVGPLSVVVHKGQVFDYFDEVRRIIEPAREEVFFVDPYLDAEFIGRYLPHVAPGTAVRLLGGKRIATLLSAVDLFVQQSGTRIEVRSSSDIHERYVFVDRNTCYLSGASFKDGAKKAPAALTQIIDAFKPMWETYEAAWRAASMERLA